MAQEFKQVFYKKVRVKGIRGGERDVYLFKSYDRFDKGKWKLSFITAYKSRMGDDFIVESGSGISKERMESQVMGYLKRWVD